ncbi:MAG TPA: DUF72 domain-containing protein [Cellvibrio sp.]|nr:DUF72 domain-containing protein [Cellvibrio sp.]
MSDIRIGISGWRYASWRKNFYPKGLRQKDELHFASRAVNSIEINGSFYGLQSPTSYAKWYADTPDNFTFSVKASRYITHIKRLRDIEQPLANFFASGIFHLKEKLGPFLWQFPPSFKFDETLFEEFLMQLPMTSDAAKAHALHSEPEVQREGYLDIPPKMRLRHAVEIRNESFVDETFIHLLRRHRVALVVADTAGRWPQLEDLTSDFVYMRLHGDLELYNSGYSDQALERWYKRIRLWSQGRQPSDAKLVVKEKDSAQGPRDVYCYFDNTDKLFAPYDARKVLERLGLADKLKAKPGEMMEDGE